MTPHTDTTEASCPHCGHLYVNLPKHIAKQHTDTDWLDGVFEHYRILIINGLQQGYNYRDIAVEAEKEAKTAIANKLAQSKKALFLELISECEPLFGAAGGVAINRQSLIDKVEAL